MSTTRTRTERNNPKQWAATFGGAREANKLPVAAFMAPYEPHKRGTPRPSHTYRAARRNVAKYRRAGTEVH